MNSIVRIISAFYDSANRRFIKFTRLNRTESAAEAMPFGIDSNPLNGMIAIYAATRTHGNPVIIGYVNKHQLAAIGELRLFSKSDDATVATSIWLKNDGTMEIGGNTDFMARFGELKEGFDQLRSDFNTHVHSSNGTPPTVLSVASIDDAKIEEIKTS